MEALLIQMIIQAIFIAVPVTVIIDIVGVMEWVKERLYYLRYTKESTYEPYSIKPFDCSMCMSSWIYAFVFWEISIFIIVGMTLATLTSLIIRKYIILK